MDYRKAVEELCNDKEFQKEICDYGLAKKRLVIRLSNPELEERYPEDCLVQFPYLDLKMGFALEVDELDGVSGLVHVTKQLAERWEVSPEQILQDARKNALGIDHYIVEDFCAVVRNLLLSPGVYPEEVRQSLEENTAPMYILTDRSRRNGSMALVVKELLCRFSEILGEDLIILPSSVNELIFFADHGKRDYEWLKKTVRHVNDSAVPKNEILSYSVYYYSREDDEVRIVA